MSNETIIGRDIEQYEADLEEYQKKLRRCLVKHEPRWKNIILACKDVITSLKTLEEITNKPEEPETRHLYEVTWVLPNGDWVWRREFATDYHDITSWATSDLPQKNESVSPKARLIRIQLMPSPS